MSAFLTSLASLGAQYGEAKDQLRQEREAREQRLHSMNVEDAYLQIARQAEQRQKQEFDARVKAGHYLQVGSRLFDVNQGKWVDFPRSPSALEKLQAFIVTQPKEIQGQLRYRAQVEVEGEPDPDKGASNALREVLKYSDEYQKEGREEATRRLDKIQASVDRERTWQEHRGEVESFERSMVPFRLGQKSLEPTADERRRADLAENMSENLDQLEEIVKRRPDLFGPHGAGLLTSLRGMIGTSDLDIASLKAIHEYLGLASLGAHSMRAAARIGQAADAVIAGYRNSPEAMLAAIQRARASIATFKADTERAKRAGTLGDEGIPTPITSGATDQPAPDPAVEQYLQKHGVKKQAGVK